ncbi:MAG: copper amine oxidase N-terminal domain-containing protein, partial [Candidatus Limnocylindria bacterium]
WNRIWSAHNGFFVDYTTGVATGDTAMQDQAVSDLTDIYVVEFSAFLSGATGLPEDAVAGLVTDHVLQTKAVVDAQAAGDWDAAYEAIRTAYAHMQMIGDALAPAIVEGNDIDGAADTAGVDFRVALNQLLQEHLFVASFATDAALGGRDDEFAAAGATLNTNGTDLGAAIGTIYGDEAADEFNRIWSAHNGFFVDYTTGVATDDMALQDQAVTDLTETYVPEFSAFLAGATGLPEDALAELITEHVLTTKAIVDAQGAGDAAAGAEADRTAAMHMRMIGDPLAEAIVASMPESFQ